MPGFAAFGRSCEGRGPLAGYSGTPLPRKLGLKPGQSRLVIGTPVALRGIWEGVPPTLFTDHVADAAGPFDMIHLFVTRRSALEAGLAPLRGLMRPAGMLWVSWPKRASGVATDVTEDVIRERALAAGLVDIKVCALDATWSGLKLVIPVRSRGPAR